jgi:UDP:flavonoid glycosyltransferase YjiC (YdhE family)
LTVIPHPGKKKVANLMKIGFIGLLVPGHFNPMSAVARQLQSREQDVVMLSLS